MLLLKCTEISSALRKFAAKVQDALGHIRERERKEARAHDALLRGRVARERVAHSAEHERGYRPEQQVTCAAGPASVSAPPNQVGMRARYSFRAARWPLSYADRGRQGWGSRPG